MKTEYTNVELDIEWMSELSKAATGVRVRKDWESMSQKDIDWYVDFYKRELEKRNQEYQDYLDS